MAELIIDFTWHQDERGYRLIPGSQFLVAVLGSQQWIASSREDGRHPTRASCERAVR